MLNEERIKLLRYLFSPNKEDYKKFLELCLQILKRKIKKEYLRRNEQNLQR
jgi:hypothetical protein